MSALPQKVREFLEELEDSDNPSAEEREKAAILLAETLRAKNIYVLKRTKEIKTIANDLKKARMRLEDIHTRLQLSIKAGHSSNTVH